MKRWLDLSKDKPWEKEEGLQFGIPNKKKITTDDYMQKGWNDCPPGAHPYVRGSRHNKIGMWIMWVYYVLIIGMVIILILVINS